jgi:hypothetical protein
MALRRRDGCRQHYTIRGSMQHPSKHTAKSLTAGFATILASAKIATICTLPGMGGEFQTPTKPRGAELVLFATIT